MRVPCCGEKEAQRGVPALHGPAPGTCAFSVPIPLAPEPLPSTVLGPTRSLLPCPLQNPEA